MFPHGTKWKFWFLGKKDMVEFLIKNGADVNAAEKFMEDGKEWIGSTALRSAAMNCNEEKITNSIE